MGLNLDDSEFRERLRKVISPSRPITTEELLQGREKNLRTISRAFNNPGRHVFIYGDRGVGKTSLAQTAAYKEQSADEDPIIVGCDVSASFGSIARDILRRCLPSEERFAKKTEIEKSGINLKFLNAETQKGLEKGVVPEITTVNEATDICRYLCAFHSSSPVVVIDEFDQIQNDFERQMFAQFMKQLSDQEVGIKLILCGIGGSVEALLGAHLSTDRLITPIGLERLSLDAIWRVVVDALAEFNVEIDRHLYIRIAQICDGFPYYAHLIAEQLLWAIFDAEQTVSKVTTDLYHDGIRGAIGDSENALRTAYEAAVMKYKDDYEEVLWAFADNNLLRVQVSHAYEHYERIMIKRPERKKVTRSTFDNRVNRLKREAHGQILVPKGHGWYEFRENILRGYVRLRAEKEGIELGSDHM